MTIDRAPQWVRDAAFYQIFPDRLAKGTGPVPGEVRWFEDWNSPPHPFAFKGGNLWGVIDELDRIQELGFDALYFTPVFSSPANHRYHTHDYFTIDPILGGNAAFDALLQAAHDRGMRVVLDGVFNHTGRSFFAFGHILENGTNSPYLEWFHINPRFIEEHGTLNAYPGHVDPQSVSSFEAFGYKAWWDLPALPKLNTDNPEVQEYILQIAEHWVKRGIDGWRLDVPTEIQTPGFWERFRERVRAVNPECYIVGEIWHEAPEYLQGNRFDGLMNYPLGTGIMRWTMPRFNLKLASKAAYRGFPTFASSGEFAGYVQRVQKAAGAMGLSAQLNLFTSHDTPRLASLSGHQPEAVLQALALLFALPGAPCLYYGEEYGLTGGHDPDCRGTIPENLRKHPPALYTCVHDLLALRKAQPGLRSEQLSFLTLSEAPWLRSETNLIIWRGEPLRGAGETGSDGSDHQALLILNREAEPLIVPQEVCRSWQNPDVSLVAGLQITTSQMDEAQTSAGFTVPGLSTLMVFPHGHRS